MGGLPVLLRRSDFNRSLSLHQSQIVESELRTIISVLEQYNLITIENDEVISVTDLGGRYLMSRRMV